jgi:hypothetical protein
MNVWAKLAVWGLEVNDLRRFARIREDFEAFSGARNKKGTRRSLF